MRSGPRPSLARRGASLGLVLAGAASAALLSGCATVGPNFKPPAPPTDQAYAQATDDANRGPNQAAIGDQVVADWWTLFKSPALDSLVRQAVANNRSLAEARARLAAARDDAAAAPSLLAIDANAEIQRERANLNAFSGGAFSSAASLGFPTNPEFNLYTLSPSLTYNLDLFGGERRRRESLRATAQAQANELDAAYLTLTGKVVEQALTIADANIQIQALAEIAANDQADLDMLRRAEAAGGASRADVAAAESSLAQDLAMVPAQRQRLAVARHQMAVLVGKSPADWSPPDFEAGSGSLPSLLPVSLPSELVRQRPDIRQAEARLHAATADIGVATAALYPNITLSANIAQNALTPQTMFGDVANSWSVAGGLTAPIFHGHELTAKRRKAQDEARAALAVYEETVLEAFGQVADALQAVAHDNDAYAQETKAADTAAERLAMARAGFRAGGLSAEQVIRAERDWRRLRLQLSQIGTSRYGDAARLLLATAAVPPGAAAGSGAQQPGQ